MAGEQKIENLKAETLEMSDFEKLVQQEFKAQSEEARSAVQV